MSAQTALAKISRGRKDLAVAWEMLRRQWRDEQAQRFEKDIIQNLDTDLRQATAGLEQLNEVIRQAKRDCQ